MLVSLFAYPQITINAVVKGYRSKIIAFEPHCTDFKVLS